jgi:hypothetical protein
MTINDKEINKISIFLFMEFSFLHSTVRSVTFSPGDKKNMRFQKQFILLLSAFYTGLCLTRT